MATQPSLQDLKNQRSILDTQIEIAEVNSSIETKVKQLRLAGKNEVAAIQIRKEIAALQDKLNTLGLAPRSVSGGNNKPQIQKPADPQTTSAQKQENKPAPKQEDQTTQKTGLLGWLDKKV